MGLIQRVRSFFAGPPPAPEVLPPATADERAADAFMTRAFSGVDTGSAAVTMMGAGAAPERKGRGDIMRCYSTSPWMRAASGKIGTACAAPGWHLYATPMPTKEQTEDARALLRTPVKAQRVGKSRVAYARRLTYRDVVETGLRFAPPPLELRDLDQEVRAAMVRQMLATGELVEITRHPWHRLMAQPNALISGRVARAVTIISRDLVGDGAWVLGGQNGIPTHAWPIPGTWIMQRPRPEEPTWTVQLGAGSSQVSWKVPVDALLMFSDADPMNPYGPGIGTGFVLGDEADIDEHAAKMEAAFFANGAMPAAIAMIKGARKDVLERAKREWNNFNQGFGKAFKTHFTGGEIDVKRLDTPFKDMALHELRKGQRDIFQQVFGIPPEIMGNNDSSSWATSSASEAIMAKQVVVPRCEVMREQYQRLAAYYDPRLVCDYDDPVPTNIENKRALILAVPHNFRVDEVRAAADEEPTGDEAGSGFMVTREGGVVWYGSLAQVGPQIRADHITAGVPSLNEARQALRLPAIAGPEGERPTPRSKPQPALGFIDDSARLEDDDDAEVVTEKPADTALNGAQISSLVEICDLVQQGTLPKESAKAIMLAGFQGLDESEVNAILDPIVVQEPSDDDAPDPADEGPPPAAFENASRVWIERCRRRMQRIRAAAAVSRRASPVPSPPQPPSAAAVRVLTGAELEDVVESIDVTSMLDQLEPVVAALIKEWGQETIDAIGIDGTPKFDEKSDAVRAHLRALALDRIRTKINATTKAELRAALVDALQQGPNPAEKATRAGDKTLEQFLIEAVELVFSRARDTRADAIAATESTHHSSFSAVEAMEQASETVTILKEWIATPDNLTREAHEALDGQRRALDDDFVVPPGVEHAGARADHPGNFGDPALDANCRCAVGSAILEDDGPSENAAPDGHHDKAPVVEVPNPPDDGGLSHNVRGILVGRRMLAPGASKEERAAAWRANDEALRKWDAKIARAARDGFDRQQVRVMEALTRALAT
jgi:hypothetical protein